MKLFFKFLNGIGNIVENLKVVVEGEYYEWVEMYKEFVRVVREEGFEEIVIVFEFVVKVEEKYEERYRKFFENVENGKVFVKDDVVVWKCRNCGYVYVGKEVLKVCLICKYL